MTSQLLINEPPLQILPTLAQTIGLNEAIVLQQIHYWLAPRLNNNYFEGRHWVRNTYKQWQNQFPFWGEKTIQRTIGNLEESGILMSFITRDFKKLKYYSLDYIKLESLVINSERADQKIEENRGTHPSGQVDRIDLPIREDRSGQNDLVDQVKMTRSYDIDSENTSSENTLPPLSPPSKLVTGEKIKVEEDEENLSQNLNFNLPCKQRHEEMLEIWNKAVQWKLYSGKEAHLTSKRTELLTTLLETVFGHQMASWKDYCTLIANSRFLAGENASGFKVTLDWALVPNNAYKVLEGAIYDKPEPVKNSSTVLPWEEFSEELTRTLPSNKYLAQWVKMSVTIAKFIGQQKYKSWFDKVALSEVTETKITFSVEGQFIKDSIIRCFSAEIRCAVQSLYPEIDQIEFTVIPSLGDMA